VNRGVPGQVITGITGITGPECSPMAYAGRRTHRR